MLLCTARRTFLFRGSLLFRGLPILRGPPLYRFRLWLWAVQTVRLVLGMGWKVRDVASTDENGSKPDLL